MVVKNKLCSDELLCYEEVFQFFMQLDTNKATGTDGIFAYNYA